MTANLKIALIGCGRIARKHAEILTSGQVEGVELVAVCDIVPERAEALGKKYGVSHCDDMDIMMSSVKPDAVSILTPSGDHACHICRLAWYGAHIIVEKPLCLTLEDAKIVTDACRVEKIQLAVVKQNRYNVAVQHARKAYENGRLGEIQLASVRVRWNRKPDYYEDWHGQWSMAGGVLANQAIHHVDLLQWFCGSVKRVAAFGKLSPYTEVETGLVATLEFESGAIGTIEATTLTEPTNLEGSLSLLGTKGTIVLGGFAVNEIEGWLFDEMHDLETAQFSESPPDVYGFGHAKFYNDVLDCIREGRPVPVDGLEAAKSLEIVTAIYEAMELGETIELGGDYAFSRLGR